jgi:hypothetical protein
MKNLRLSVQKKFNRTLSKKRAVMKHTITKPKKFWTMAREFRYHLKRYDLMTDLVPSLANLRVLRGPDAQPFLRL